MGTLRPGAQQSLAPIIPGRNWPHSRTYASSLKYLTLLSSGHLFLKRMPSALQGVSAQHVSSWLRCFPTASSVTGRILEVLRYVPIPAVRARIRRPRQPNVCEACFACVLDPDSFRTAGSGRCVTHWTCHTYTLPCHQHDASWQLRVLFQSLKGETLFSPRNATTS